MEVEDWVGLQALPPIFSSPFFTKNDFGGMKLRLRHPRNESMRLFLVCVFRVCCKAIESDRPAQQQERVKTVIR
jgi:hypothetical protein